MTLKHFLFPAMLAMLFITACVPQRKYQDTRNMLNEAREQNKNCQQNLSEALKKNEEMEEQMGEIDRMNTILRRDTARFGSEYRRIKRLNDNLNELYEKVIAQNKDLLNTSSAENERLKLELEDKRRKLENKEKFLQQKEEDIRKLSEDIKRREEQMEQLTGDLQERSRRVSELETIINRKDSAVNALKNKINSAFLGFKEDELSVEMKNGKVYVSLSEQLLFGSGSIKVNQDGKEALEKLAEVLKKNKDINILVEGHTDTVPIKTNCMKDNWDLSVLRATSIVRILTESEEVDPTRIIAAGRGEFLPVASNESKDGRQKNRRTEIILTPKLDELLQVLETH